MNHDHHHVHVHTHSYNKACLQVVALLGTIQYSGATCTSATSLPLPLTSLCPWDYPLVYIIAHRRHLSYILYNRSPVVRFVVGSHILWHFSVPVAYGGSGIPTYSY